MPRKSPLRFHERKLIERMYENEDATFTEIAAAVGCCAATVSIEVRRGATGKLNRFMRPEYSAELGQLRYREASSRCGRKKASIKGLM